MGYKKSTTPASERDRWRTPADEFARLNAQYGPFTLDCAADETNHLTPLWLGPGSGRAADALAIDWCNYDGTPARCYCNPPFSLVERFVAHAHNQVMKGAARSATLLVPAATDVRWFHKFVWNAEIGQPRPFVKVNFSVGRIRFLRPDGTEAKTDMRGTLIAHIEKYAR